MTSDHDAIVLSPCGFDLDPRHEYWVESLEKLGFRPLRLQVLEQTESARIAKSSRLSGDLMTVRSNRRRKTAEIEQQLGTKFFSTHTTLGRFLSARVARLLEAASSDSVVTLFPRIVIANDLMGLIVACALWNRTETIIVYDAQEVFTESYEVLGGPQLSDSEKSAWIAFESELCKQANLVVTISPGIAELYQERHETNCLVLPNFVPQSRVADPPQVGTAGPARFVFIGRAEPLRGLEEIITQWDVPSTIATCDLIMPFTPQRKRFEALSSRITRRFDGPNFRSPVAPDQMIGTLCKYDVGILPYRYSYPYSHASPNKFGEYMAAGLALIANDQHYVRTLIEEHQLGLIFDWNQSGEFVEAVNQISQADRLRTHRNNVKIAARSHLNWDQAGNDVWKFLKDIPRLPEVGRSPITECQTPAIDISLRARPDEWLRWHFRSLIMAAGPATISWLRALKEHRLAKSQR